MVLDDLKKAFGKEILATVTKNERRMTVTIQPGALVPMAEHLFKDLGFRFIIASALHTKRGFEIYYHFSLDQTGVYWLPQQDKEVKSIQVDGVKQRVVLP